MVSKQTVEQNTKNSRIKEKKNIFKMYTFKIVILLFILFNSTIEYCKAFFLFVVSVVFSMNLYVFMFSNELSIYVLRFYEKIKKTMFLQQNFSRVFL